MKRRRDSSALLTLVLLGTGIADLAQAKSSEAGCGCVESSSLKEKDILAWTLFPKVDPGVESEPSPKSKCDSFCQGAKHFTLSPWTGKKYSAKSSVNQDRVLCQCYKRLITFDCDEEVGVDLVRIHCKTETVEVWDNQPERDVMASIKEGIQKANLRRDRAFSAGLRPALRQETRNGTGPQVVSEGKAKEQAMALTAFILGMIAMICLGTLATVTYYTHRRERQKLAEADVETAAAAAGAAKDDATKVSPSGDSNWTLK